MKQIALIVIVVCVFACVNDSGTGVDPFFTDKGGLDYGRFPVLKPYEMVIGSNQWFLRSIDTTEVPISVPGTKYISVLDSIIFSYSEKTLVNGQDADKGWFITIPKVNITKAFNDHQAYLTYLRSLGYAKEPLLYDAFDVFEYFDKHDTVDWKGISLDLKPMAR